MIMIFFCRRVKEIQVEGVSVASMVSSATLYVIIAINKIIIIITIL